MAESQKAQTPAFNAQDRLLKAVRDGDVILTAGDEERFRKMNLSEKDMDRLRSEGAIQGFFGPKQAELEDDPTVMVTAASAGFEEGKQVNHVHGNVGDAKSMFDDGFAPAPTPSHATPKHGKGK